MYFLLFSWFPLVFTTIIEVATEPAVVGRAQFGQISIGLASVSHDDTIFLLDSENCF